MALTTIEGARSYKLIDLGLETTNMQEDEFAWDVIAPQIKQGRGGGGITIKSVGEYTQIKTSTQRALNSIADAFKDGGFKQEV